MVFCAVPLAVLSVALCVGARQAALCPFRLTAVRRRWQQVCRVQFRGSADFPVLSLVHYGFMSSAPSAAAVADTRFGGGHPPPLMLIV